MAIFSEIIEPLKNGCKVRRRSWNKGANNSCYIKPSPNMEYFEMYDLHGTLFSKQCMLHCYDLLADDWEIVKI